MHTHMPLKPTFVYFKNINALILHIFINSMLVIKKKHLLNIFISNFVKEINSRLAYEN